MKDIILFKPEINREEMEEIREISLKIWNKMATKYKPIKHLKKDSACFIRHSIKIEKKHGEIMVLDTTNQPYSPIYNKYILRLILGNILKDAI